MALEPTDNIALFWCVLCDMVTCHCIGQYIVIIYFIIVIFLNACSRKILYATYFINIHIEALILKIIIFLAVILSCHWSKHGHVTKIFCDIVTRKSVFQGVLTARSIHPFYDGVFVFSPFATGATVVFKIDFDIEEEKLNVSNQWISRKIIGLLNLNLRQQSNIY